MKLPDLEIPRILGEWYENKYLFFFAAAVFIILILTLLAIGYVVIFT